MLALARLQRKIRLVDSPYKTPQTLTGGPRQDAALVASSGRTATTKAMGKDSTQHQHLVQVEVPNELLEEWLAIWSEGHNLGQKLRVELRPYRAGSELLKLSVRGESEDKLADIVFATIQDRRGHVILSVRDQNTFDTALRKKRLMTLLHLFLIHRYKVDLIHYVSPTDDNRRQTSSMKTLSIFSAVNDEIGEIIVAEVDAEGIATLLDPEQEALRDLIKKRSA
jgi:isocitrate lyase